MRVVAIAVDSVVCSQHTPGYPRSIPADDTISVLRDQSPPVSFLGLRQGAAAPPSVATAVAALAPSHPCVSLNQVLCVDVLFNWIEVAKLLFFSALLLALAPLHLAGAL